MGSFLADYLLHQEKQKNMISDARWQGQCLEYLGYTYNFDVCINAWEKRKDGLGINVNKNQDAKKLFKLGHAL